MPCSDRIASSARLARKMKRSSIFSALCGSEWGRHAWLTRQLAAETGLSAHAVAAAFGHDSVTTTLQSYAKAGASARQEKVLTVLAGGRGKKGEESAA
jgi:hypothetical protein